MYTRRETGKFLGGVIFRPRFNDGEEEQDGGQNGTETTTQQSGPDLSGYRLRKMEISAYTAGPESTGKYPDYSGYAKTALGTIAAKGRTVSAGPQFPLGTTQLYIPLFDSSSEAFASLPAQLQQYWDGNRGLFVVEDRGGGINGNKVDIYFGDPANKYYHDSPMTWSEYGRSIFYSPLDLALLFGRRRNVEVYTNI